jgi:hypothetical protein
MYRAKEDLAKGSSAAQVTKTKPRAASTSKSVKAAPLEDDSSAMEVSEDMPETLETQLEQVFTQTLEKYHVCSLPFLNIFVTERRNNKGMWNFSN